MRAQPILILFGLIVTILLAGCKMTPKEDFPDPVIETSLSEKFTERRPIDIAVMPVYSAPEEIPPMVRVLRRRIKTELLNKNYSPISFDSIDEKLGAFPERRRFDLNQIRGNFDEDALLQVSLDRWDRTHLRSRLTVIVSAEFILYDSRTGEPLWKYRVTDQAVKVPSLSPDGSGGGGYEVTVADKLVREVFKGFPAKQMPTKTPLGGE